LDDTDAEQERHEKKPEPEGSLRDGTKRKIRAIQVNFVPIERI
jgi:hypothetical protein